MDNAIKLVNAAIQYIELHLSEKLDLDIVADALHYSKFHLHHIFTRTVGLTLHDYIQRRQLTEAAKLLVFSEQPILDIALFAGYESQQAFSTIFKAMYKKSPHQYRKEEEFYPLQLMYVLTDNSAMASGGSGRNMQDSGRNVEDSAEKSKENNWEEKIILAENKDIPAWMNLVYLVIDGFPHLHEEDYHRQLQNDIDQKRAFMVKDGDRAIGIMMFNEKTGSIDFLGIHPQYRKQGIAQALLKRAFSELAAPVSCISITTFREGDKADTGYRKLFQQLGFAEAELFVEFGYPTQRFILWKENFDG